MVRVAIVTTSCDVLEKNGHKTGLWFEELAAPYYVFKEKGYEVVVASIKGGDAPVDGMSLQGDFVKPECCQKALKDEGFQAAKKGSVAVADLKAEDLDGVYLSGGHGTCGDFLGTEALTGLVESMVAKGGVVGAVCHGVLGLFEAKASGEPLLKGKRCTGFSNSEEAAVQLTDAVPFTPEARMVELGGVYEKGDDWNPNSVVDGKIVTGQNPASSAAVAENMVGLL
ncbi:class I glutamine amidotransferase-like protein [Chloropicon primus]|uniref:Class I glutamine amidotransferase-like protein n=1 Tax=Chloropicon primus TaxID=1764295 RepID=A0A5B8MSA2_9CHLO|nr:class I glutamine amidotransferase-like protein [Chloropicon primus]|eukprot:QDZ23167.1 class I glutamine amidotransferase-like protein [Chloropicon primus]